MDKKEAWDAMVNVRAGMGVIRIHEPQVKGVPVTEHELVLNQQRIAYEAKLAAMTARAEAAEAVVEKLPVTRDGVKWVNPTNPNEALNAMWALASNMLSGLEYRDETGVSRGSRYYKDGKGFEMRIDSLGTASQVVGGGAYEGGVGFAVGVDRLVMGMDNKE